MRVRSTRLAAVGLGVVSMIAVAVWAAEKEGKEEKVELDQVPAAVKATILKEAAGGKVEDISKETEDGKTVYEADVKKDGQEFELKVAEDGKLIAKEAEEEEKEGKDKDDEKDEEKGGEEKPISIDQVPAKAREALIKQAGGAKFDKVTAEEEDDVDLFEANWTANGLACSATVTAEGAIVEIEEQLNAKDVPPAVLKAARKMLADGTEFTFEKKVTVVYEVKAKVKGKAREVELTPCGTPADKEEGDEEEEHEGEQEKEEKNEK